MSRRYHTSVLVERVLKNNVQARNSDRALIAYVLKELGFQFSQRQMDIFLELSFESITRCRRKFQEQGKYLPTEEVLKERQFKSMVVQQNAPRTAAEDMPRLTESPQAISWLDGED